MMTQLRRTGTTFMLVALMVLWPASAMAHERASEAPMGPANTGSDTPAAPSDIRCEVFPDPLSGADVLHCAPESEWDMSCRKTMFALAASVSIFGGASFIIGRIAIAGLSYVGIFECDD